MSCITLIFKQLYNMSFNRVYTCYIPQQVLFSYLTCYIQRYILVVNCICKMFYCYITFSLTWYTTCYICCIVCYITKVIHNIRCMLYNLSQPSKSWRLASDLTGNDSSIKNAGTTWKGKLRPPIVHLLLWRLWACCQWRRLAYPEGIVGVAGTLIGSEPSGCRLEVGHVSVMWPTKLEIYVPATPTVPNANFATKELSTGANWHWKEDASSFLFVRAVFI